MTYILHNPVLRAELVSTEIPFFKLLTHFRSVGVSHIHTCAINWMIFTKILRGMSLGTTLRLPLGNKVEVMDVRRLGEEGLPFY